MSRTFLISEVFPPQHGGSARWFREIYGRLDPNRYEVVSADIGDTAEKDRSQPLRIHRPWSPTIEWGRLTFRGAWAYRRRVGQLRRLVADRGVTMLHAGRNLPEGYVAYRTARLTGRRYAVYTHGEDLGIAATSLEFRWMTQRIFRRSSAVIANSDNTRRILIDRWQIPVDRIALLYPGVDTVRFTPQVDARRRRRLGWADRTVILTVGRLQKRKGQDMMIRALPAIKQRIPNILYVVAGAGEMRGELEKLVDLHAVRSSVVFAGEPADADLIEYYRGCDLFALPNRTVGGDFEGFGMVLLEAQACGRPVLTGDSGGTRETLEPGRTGVVTDCTEPDRLARAVVELLQAPDRLQQMASAARPWAERFGWDASVARAESVFRTWESDPPASI